MLENPALLKELGILYPNHTLTASGVSAGNWSAIFDKKEKKQPSKTKIDKLLKQFNTSDAQALLFSSENFFGRINVLAEAIPTARFIFYLRNPLSLTESLYNQNVKNFGETVPFEIKTRKPNFGTIGHIRDFAKAHGTDRLIVKYFHPQFYHRGNIVNDIIEAMGISENVDIESSSVNLSYTLEALETKRFLNNFKLSPYSDHALNNLLQQNQEGTLNYSLLKPEDFGRHLQHVVDELEVFFQEIPCPESKKFIDATKETRQKKYVEQTISLSDLANIRDYLIFNNKPLYYHICHKIISSKDSSLKKDILATTFLEKYGKSTATRVLFCTKFYLQKVAFINQLRIKKLLG